MPTPDSPAPLGPPLEEMYYESFEELRAVLDEHAKSYGFALSVSSSNQKRVFLNCSKYGKYNPKGKKPEVHESKRRKHTGTTKTDCKFQVVARKSDNKKGWNLAIICNDHNHEAATSLSALPQYRTKSLTSEERLKIMEMYKLRHPPAQVLSALRRANPKLELVPRDIYNLFADIRVAELNGLTPMEWLVEV
jgi:hypothetical protein